MKGMIFTEFMDMVEQAHGLELVEQLIARSNLSTQGAYTAVGNYDFNELARLVVELSRVTGAPMPDLLFAFGQHVFDHLFVPHYGSFFRHAPSAFVFLEGVESYVHSEVRKLYPDAELPGFKCNRVGDRQLVMEYSSTRPLADFAHGLIVACVRHYRESIEVGKQDTSDGRGTAARFTLTLRA